MTKRRSMVLALVLVFTIMLSACGPVATEYLQESKKVQEWAGQKFQYDFSAKITMDMGTLEDGEELEPVTMEMPGKITGMSEGQEKAYIKVDMNMDFAQLLGTLPEAEQEEAKEELDKMPINDPIEIYVDGADVYFSKNYFTAFSASEELANIEQNFIKIKSDVEVDENYTAKLKEATNKWLELLTKYDGGKDMTKEGNTYSFSYTAAEGKNEVVNFAKFAKDNSDEITAILTPILDAVGIRTNSELMAEFKEGLQEIDTKEMEEGLQELVEMIEGSYIKGDVTFEDTKVTQKITSQIKVEDFMTIDYNISGVANKAEDVKVVLPTEYKELTSEELTELMIQLPEDYERVVLVFIDEELVISDVEPFIENGRTLIPVRAFMESQDALVEWDEDTREVTVTHGETKIELTIDSNIAKIDGEEVELDVPAKIVEGRTFIPLRFVSENLDYNVEYEMTDFAHEINITTK